jgi:predicted transcriptional regulator
MQISVDLDSGDVKALDIIARREGLSRAALISSAIAEFLSRQLVQDGFGVWSSRSDAPDGVAFQRKIRDEW